MIYCRLDFFDTGQGHVAAVVKLERNFGLCSVWGISRVPEELEASEEESLYM
jgi:hypothetical protein